VSYVLNTFIYTLLGKEVDFSGDSGINLASLLTRVLAYAFIHQCSTTGSLVFGNKEQ
jgi:NhaP-type Na+/H+ or K+/H+ antiporter